MPQTPVLCPRVPLPRDLDVAVSISRPQTEIATDMTLACFLTPDAPYGADNGRVRYYSTFEALQADFAPGSSGYFAGLAFFSRSVRPLTLAVARVFENPVPAGLLVPAPKSGPLLRSVLDGAFDLEVNGALVSVSGVDLSGVRGPEDLAAALSGKISGVAVSAKYGGVCLETELAGEGATLSYAASPTAGTDISALLGLTKEAGARLWPGYAPKGLAAEAALAANAARCALRLPYGWAIDAAYRETEAQKEMAGWAESLVPAYFSACTNSAAAMNGADTANIGAYCAEKGFLRSSVIYHDNAQLYPDLSYLALALATNYSQPDSALTMKFKQLDGMEPSPLTETELSVLNSRRVNCYVYMGNSSRTLREGVQSAENWFTDSLVNLDNFREELQVEVYNVFLRNKKLPYTAAGQDKLVSAAAKICRKYVRNGVFADRDVESDTESGFTTLPAFAISPVPVALSTASERAARIAPPILITAYEAGAFHKVSINVDVYN